MNSRHRLGATTVQRRKQALDPARRHTRFGQLCQQPIAFPLREGPAEFIEKNGAVADTTEVGGKSLVVSQVRTAKDVDAQLAVLRRRAGGPG